MDTNKTMDKTLGYREVGYDTGDRYIMIHTTDGGFDYSIYDRDYHLLDGGVLEHSDGADPIKAMELAVQDILCEEGIPFDNCRAVEYEEIEAKISKVEEEEFRNSRRISRVMDVPELEL